MYVCAPHMQLVSDPQGLELQMSVSCPVGARNGTQVLWKSNKCPEQPSCCRVFVYTV